jgi:hypothetical protein
MDFSKLKKRAGQGIESLQAKLEEMSGSQGKVDDRFWKMTLDSTASGSAVIRFLPAADDEVPMVKEVSYFFRGPGGVYGELSPSMIGKECPIRDRNGEDWAKAEANGDEALKNQVRDRGQNVKFYTNILVIDDQGNPENNGKVFLFKFGKQIKNIIDKQIKPEYADEKPIDPFDMWFGANFKFRAKGREMPDRRTGKKIMVPNYEDSKFADAGELFPGDDAKKEEVWKLTTSLAEFTDLTRFKDYETLKAHMLKVIGDGSGGTSTRKSAADMDDDKNDVPMQDQNKPAATAADDADKSANSNANVPDDSDDDLAFFASLMEQK